LDIAKGISTVKVNELIALLSQLPSDADVVVKGYEEGVDDVIDVKLVQIRRGVHEEWYYGRHAIDDAGDVQAVFLAGLERQPDR
jgi:hypothetical protein